MYDEQSLSLNAANNLWNKRYFTALLRQSSLIGPGRDLGPSLNDSQRNSEVKGWDILLLACRLCMMKLMHYDPDVVDRLLPSSCHLFCVHVSVKGLSY